MMRCVPLWAPWAQVQVPRVTQHIVDCAIQVHGGGGVCEDFPLSRLWVAARTLRIADGPDEVHLLSIAKSSLKTLARRSRL